MAVHFTRERMQAVLDNYEAWWDKKLDRPLVPCCLYGAHDVEEKAKAPHLDQSTCADFSWTAEQLVEKMDEELSSCEWIGDGYPMVNIAGFGPGVLAAFCGAVLDNSNGAVWFRAAEKKHIGDVHCVYDPENRWAARIKDIYRAGIDRWQGSVLMSMPDLGGVLDVAATLVGTEELLLDLYDEPEEVKRLISEIETAWYAAYRDFEEVLRPQGGYTNWAGLASRRPGYIVQCDFCYMIGNAMFREFVLDTIRRDTERLDRVIYHLDGVGQLNHLDDILSLPGVAAIQWEPGAGNPYGAYWMDVYRRIEAAGKHAWLTGSLEENLQVLGELHNTPYLRIGFDAEDREKAERILAIR